MIVRMTSEIRKRRKQLKLTQKALAIKAKIGERTVQRAEKGERIDLYNAEAISRVLGLKCEAVTVCDLTEKELENIINRDRLESQSIMAQEKASRLGVMNLSNVKIKDTVTVRYLGRSGAIPLKDGDKLNKYFFTKDLSSDLDECKIDLSLFLRESELLRLIDRIYEQYDENYCYLSSEEYEKLDDNIKKMLHTKIIAFMLGQEIQVSIINNDYIEIIDFYPKARLESIQTLDQLNRLLEDCLHIKEVSLNHSIIGMGAELVDKIIRSSLKLDIEHPIYDFVKYNKSKYEKLRSLYMELSYIYICYLNSDLDHKDAKKRINSVVEQIEEYKNLMFDYWRIVMECTIPELINN